MESEMTRHSSILSVILSVAITVLLALPVHGDGQSSSTDNNALAQALTATRETYSDLTRQFAEISRIQKDAVASWWRTENVPHARGRPGRGGISVDPRSTAKNAAQWGLLSPAALFSSSVDQLTAALGGTDPATARILSSREFLFLIDLAKLLSFDPEAAANVETPIRPRPLTFIELENEMALLNAFFVAVMVDVALLNEVPVIRDLAIENIEAAVGLRATHFPAFANDKIWNSVQGKFRGLRNRLRFSQWACRLNLITI
jgi:hypothetical protein